MIRPTVAALLLVLLSVAGTFAQSMDMGTHTAVPPPADKGPADVDDRMEQSMQVPPTGDADRDFAAMMLAHHQGAVDMAKLELLHGRDAELRALAEKIIAAQQAEIAQLQAWLARRK